MIRVLSVVTLCFAVAYMSEECDMSSQSKDLRVGERFVVTVDGATPSKLGRKSYVTEY